MKINLEKKRFNPTENSLIQFRALEACLNEIEKEYPEVKGISFFGSKTLGTENPESDIDLVVFFDGMELINNRQLSEEAYKYKKREGFTKDPIVNKFFAILHHLNPAKIQEPKMVDISSIETKKLVQDFIAHYRVMIVNDYLVSNNDVLEWSDLVSRFFLGVGKGLYKNRNEILNEFAEAEGGEECFQVLIQILQYVERIYPATHRRNIPLEYRSYPNSIEQARKFFITREPKITRQVQSK